jgi:hypothetical protein
MGQLTQTTTQLQTILNDSDASNAGNTSISDASDTTATSLKKSGFFSIQASSSNAPSTDRAVLISAVRNTTATGEIRYGQLAITESNGLWWNSDDGGSLGTWYESVGTAATQTLTNKTLTSPVLTTPQINDSSADHQYVFASANLAADRTVSLPLLTGNDSFVFEAHAQTLTNKILTAPVLSGSSSAAGSILFKEDTDNGTNAVTLIGPAATADVTVTLPAATDTLVGKATTDTLTNKTLTSAVLNTGVSGTAVLDEDNMASDSATKLATQQSIKAYVDGQVSGVTASSTTTFSNKTISGSNNTLSNIAVSSTLLAAGTGISLSTNTLNLDAAQTGITSIYATDLILGEDAQTAIDFGTANEIDFKVDNAARLTVTASALYPVTNNQIDLGTASLEFKDAFFDGTVTSDAFAGPLTGNVTGNVSGTAATVTGAAQSNITSLGTLTTLTVDSVIINGSTIGHTGDTDLMTVASGVLTVAGEVSMTTLDIGGTNVTSTAAELNILDGVTSTAAELNILDGVTSTAAEINRLDGVASAIRTAGLETIYVPAAAMYPNTTDGSSDLEQVELSNGPELKCLDFAAAADDFAQFTVIFPKSWNEGTVTFQAFWTVTGTNTGTVAWGLSGISFADNASINTAFGTQVVATAKAFSGTSNDMTVSAVSGAVTISNAAVDTQTYFQVSRDVSADSQTGSARLLGIKLFFTTDAANDG